MAAPPERVWELVSDVTRIGEFSPETFEAEWLDGATGPAVGAKFRGHVKRNGKGPIYWVNCTVIVSEPGREFTFGTAGNTEPLNVWSYKLEPEGDGTDVTESFTLANKLLLRVYWAVLGWARGPTNRNGMRTTLERIKAVVE
jgi:uncharacterized protein YndB with AHSA1/START domain